jgi:hypothetical protein
MVDRFRLSGIEVDTLGGVRDGKLARAVGYALRRRVRGRGIVDVRDVGRAAMIQREAGMVKASGVLQCDTLIANSVIDASSP